MPEITPMSEIAAIVLAAGASRRFGSDKLLHPVTRHGVTLPLAAHSLLPWMYAFRQVTMVVGPDRDAFRCEIEAALGECSRAIRWAVCEDAVQGMAFSIARGVHANRDAAGWLIGLADMPTVPLAAIARVRNALLGGAGLAAPACEGVRGHPVGFAARHREELLELRGDTGARLLLERDSARVQHVEIDDGGIFADIDVPDDLLCVQAGRELVMA